MHMLCNFFANPDIATNKMIIIQQFLVLKKNMRVFFIIISPYIHESRWSVTIEQTLHPV